MKASFLPRESGFTLTELTVVMVISVIVTVGIVTFYLSSQGMWIEASSQALTQRDATLVLQRMTLEARRSNDATVQDFPLGSAYQAVGFIMSDTTWFYRDPSDSLIHMSVGRDIGDDDHGPVATSRVERFELDTNRSLVYLIDLSMRSTSGDPVHIASTMALYNK